MYYQTIEIIAKDFVAFCTFCICLCIIVEKISKIVKKYNRQKRDAKGLHLFLREFSIRTNR